MYPHTWCKFTGTFTSAAYFNWMAAYGLPVGDTRVTTLRVLPVGSLHRQPPRSGRNLKRDKSGQGRRLKFPAKGYSEKPPCDNRLQSFHSRLVALPAANRPIIVRNQGDGLIGITTLPAREQPNVLNSTTQIPPNQQVRGRPNPEHTFWKHCPLAVSPSLLHFLTCRSETKHSLFSLKAQPSAHYLCWTRLSSQKSSSVSLHLWKLCQEHSDGSGWKSHLEQYSFTRFCYNSNPTVQLNKLTFWLTSVWHSAETIKKTILA